MCVCVSETMWFHFQKLASNLYTGKASQVYLSIELQLVAISKSNQFSGWVSEVYTR